MKNLLDLIPIEHITSNELFENETTLKFNPLNIETSLFFSLQPNISGFINSLYSYVNNKDITPIQNKVKIIPIWKEKININKNHLTPYLLKEKFGLNNFISVQFIRMTDYDGNYFHPVRIGFKEMNGFHFFLKDIINPYMKQVPIKCKSLNSILGINNHFISNISDINFNFKQINKEFNTLYLYLIDGEYMLDSLLKKIIQNKDRWTKILIEYELIEISNLVKIFSEFDQNEYILNKIIYSPLGTGLIFIFIKKSESIEKDHVLKISENTKQSNIIFSCWNKWINCNTTNKLIKKILDTENLIQSIKFPDFLSPFINQYVSSGFKDIDFGSYKKLLPKNFSFFPDKHDLKKNKILISDFSMRYISKPDMSSFITSKIKEKVGENIIITDAMANVGGNTINFVTHFKFVNAIEINKVSFDCLKNNIELYADTDNYKLYNANYLEIAEDLIQDVVFVDPPWGGSFYKYYTSIHIHFNSISLSTLVSVLKTRYVVLKLPFNMNLQRFLLDVNYKECSIFFFQNIFIVILKIK